MQHEPYDNATSLCTVIKKSEPTIRQAVHDGSYVQVMADLKPTMAKTKTAIVATMAKKSFPEEFQHPLFCLKFLMSFQKVKGAGKLGPEFLAAQQQVLQGFMVALPTGQPQRPPQQPVAGPLRMQPPPAP
ncbi:hypothetical protein M413DRAFT_29738 [Hebeloma cylindrosporum]|uniref:Uncharacterized protein n=1 Tax=Hebeloma cylindrosporum TaxID=76867 RepID=A0A0C3BQ53_HEBCY|nr:hypothetical protein M413DRAFT_29738 [Hebeloma cylindrosporum h7]